MLARFLLSMHWMRLGTSLALASVILLACSESHDAEAPPNIVLIIGDDVGWTDYGFMGSKVVRTPNLDRLAEGGTVFTHVFATDSVCRPSHVTLLTGRHPEAIDRARRQRPPRRRSAAIRHLVDTLPMELARRGYASFQGGKFWEGTFRDAGFTHGMTRSLEPVIPEEGERNWSNRAGSEGLTLGRETMEPLFSFLEAQRERPFFVWFAPVLPHLPFDAPEEFQQLYAAEPAPPFVRGYWSNLTRLDSVIGQALKRIDDLGLREKTLVVYVADNGWDTEGRPQTLMGGARGKGSIYEMGFRTPMIVSWPGHVAAGVRDAHLVSLADVYPTLLEFARPSAVSGPSQNVYGLLTGNRDFGRESVVGGSTRSGLRSYFLRTEEWRYVRRPDGIEELYRIQSDPRETDDLAADHPQVLKAMRQALDTQLSVELRAPRKPHLRAARGVDR